ncbi:ABC transporter permease subunit [Paracoccus sp. S-4012]|uniref:ABC transporter permease n=1 Tax=Paracoccus sp. S-4012 TaxID=2665648 RepID=UPI0012AFE5AD|nr:ABC transporter permease [Paracoccus sp. S-4012]MRX50108.1 ABC transporter permease subunit [Paracoccus sp. S-4012]
MRLRLPRLAPLRGAPGAALSAVLLVVLVLYALLVPLVAPDPFSLGGLSIMDSFTPPIWAEGGNPVMPLGADDQGRNMVTAMAYGLRTSLIVGVFAVLIGLVLGGALGLVAGYAGGRTDALIMRLADVQLAYPALLLAMIIDGIVNATIGEARSTLQAMTIVILAIGVAFWVQFARTIRSSVLVERNQDYVSAARITGRSAGAIIGRHILPNVMAPVLVIATTSLGLAIIAEATLSFLGIGIPLTHPSLGALIRNGANYLQSGEWWIAIWPCLLLMVLVVAVNVLGDHLRDYYNPRLRGRS